MITYHAIFRKALYVFMGLSILSLTLSSCSSSKKGRSSYNYKRPMPKPMTTTKPAGGTTTTTTTPAPAETPVNTEVTAMARRATKIQKVLDTADSYLGTKHVMGGQSKSGIDCSGLVQISYKSIDLSLPRSTSTQISAGTKVQKSQVKKGDLVFFTYPGGTRVTHVGIVYEVKGKEDVVFIHTSSSRGVRKDNMYSDYWSKLFITARRVL